MKRAKQKVLCGADVIAKNRFDFQEKCELITSPTGVLRDLSSTVDILKEMRDLIALFGSEHGVKFVVLDGPNPLGCIKAEETVLDRRFYC